MLRPELGCVLLCDFQFWASESPAKQTCLLHHFCSQTSELQDFFPRRTLVFEFVKQMFVQQIVIPRSRIAMFWRQFFKIFVPCFGVDLLSYHPSTVESPFALALSPRVGNFKQYQSHAWLLANSAPRLRSCQAETPDKRPW